MIAFNLPNKLYTHKFSKLHIVGVNLHIVYDGVNIFQQKNYMKIFVFIYKIHHLLTIYHVWLIFADLPFAHGTHPHEGTSIACMAIHVQCSHSTIGRYVSMDALFSLSTRTT